MIGFFSDDGPIMRNYWPADIPADQLTHLNYAFAIPKDTDGDQRFEAVMGNSELAYLKPVPRRVSVTDTTRNEHLGILRQLRALKRQYPHLRILLSVGGACLYNAQSGQCESINDRFKAIISSEERLQHFVSSVVLLMTHPFPEGEDQQLFDGLDLDWEFPDAADKAGYVQLLKALRRKLDTATRVERRTFLLTADGPATSFFMQHYDVPAVAAVVDWVNVMTYLYHMPQSWNDHTGHNAPFGQAFSDPHGAGYEISQTSVRAWQHAGLPPEKMTMGLSYFGVGYRGVGSVGNSFLPGLYQRYRGALVTGGEIPYADLWSRFDAEAGWKMYWDEAAQCPFLYNARTQSWISYDDPESLRRKAVWARKNRLAGIFVWELSQEFNARQPVRHPLTNVLFEASVARTETATGAWSAKPTLSATEFRNFTTILVRIASPSEVDLQILDAQDQPVRQLLHESLVMPGYYRIPVWGSSLKPGTYQIVLSIQAKTFQINGASVRYKVPVTRLP